MLGLQVAPKERVRSPEATCIRCSCALPCFTHEPVNAQALNLKLLLACVTCWAGQVCCSQTPTRTHHPVLASCLPAARTTQQQSSPDCASAGGYYNTTVASNPTYLVYNPRTKALGPETTLTQLQATSPANLGPFVAVLPSQRIVITAHQQSQLYTYNSTTLLLTLAATPTTAPLPLLPIPATAPYTVRFLLRSPPACS